MTLGAVLLVVDVCRDACATARSDSRLPVVAAQVARGLEAVHNAGACHRDIKVH